MLTPSPNVFAFADRRNRGINRNANPISRARAPQAQISPRQTIADYILQRFAETRRHIGQSIVEKMRGLESIRRGISSNTPEDVQFSPLRIR